MLAGNPRSLLLVLALARSDTLRRQAAAYGLQAGLASGPDAPAVCRL